MERVSRESIYPRALPHSRTRIADLPVNIYPLSNFRYCRKPAKIEKDKSPMDRAWRMMMKCVFLFLLYSFPEMAITVLFGC